MMLNKLLSIDIDVVYNILEDPAWTWPLLLIGLILIAILWKGIQWTMKLFKKNPRFDKRTLEGKAYAFAESRILPLVVQQKLDYRYYSSAKTTEDLLKVAYSAAWDFSWPEEALAQELGFAVDKVNSKDFYFDIYEHQLKDIIEIHDAKDMIKEALHFARYIVDVKPARGYKQAWRNGESGIEYCQPFGEFDVDQFKEKILDFNHMFFRKYAIFIIAIRANNIVDFEARINDGLSELSIGRGSRIPREYFTQEVIRTLLDRLHLGIRYFFITDIEKVTHQNVISFCKSYFNFKDVIPKLYQRQLLEEMNQQAISR